MTDGHQASMAAHQESDYGEGRDYTHGSPHLAHDSVRSRVETDLAGLVHRIKALRGSCHVVEIGAGHGTFTDTLLQAGATVAVTEMSAPSARVLRERFAGDSRVTVVHDPEGDLSVSTVEERCDLIVMISVLHHIPDYVDVVGRLTGAMADGGAFYSTQDPTWYPTRTAWGRRIDRGAYLAWRLAQGELRRGLKTRLRRLRGTFDESVPSDMVEYHVVRNGVDQDALTDLLRSRFDTVETRVFWTTQSALLQRLGDRAGWESTFSITAY